jgi:hypothetical protein
VSKRNINVSRYLDFIDSVQRFHNFRNIGQYDYYNFKQLQTA